MTRSLRNFGIPLLILLAEIAVRTPLQAQDPNADQLEEDRGQSAWICTELTTSFSARLEKVKGQLHPVAVSDKREVSTLATQPLVFETSSSESYSTAFSELISHEARLEVPQAGSKGYRRQAATKTETESHASDGVIFSDDTREHIIHFNGLAMGARLTEQSRIKYLDPFFFPTLFLSNGAYTAKSRVEVEFPSTLEIRYKTFNLPATVRFSEERRGGTVRWVWEVERVPGLASEPASPPIRDLLPHIVLFVERYQEGGAWQPVLPDLAGLVRWYNRIQPVLPDSGSARLGAVVDSLKRVAGADPVARTRAAHAWMQHNIKYLAFEAGLAGFIPQQPGDVLRQRYSDCKGMANCLRALLERLEVPAYLSLVGTRDIPYRLEDVPSIIAFNHAIVTAYPGGPGKPIFLDCTDDKLAYPLATSSIQGKQTLVLLGGQDYRVELIPILEPARNQTAQIITSELTATDELQSRERVELTGYVNNRILHQAQGIPADKRRRMLNAIVHQDNTQVRIRHAEDKLGPQASELDYDYIVGNAIAKVGKRMFLSLQGPLSYSISKVDTVRRRYSINQEETVSMRTDHTLKLPTGVRVNYLPKDINYQEGPYRISLRYTQQPGQVRMEKLIESSILRSDRKDFASYNRFATRIKDADEDLLVLERP